MVGSLNVELHLLLRFLKVGIISGYEFAIFFLQQVRTIPDILADFLDPTKLIPHIGELVLDQPDLLVQNVMANLEVNFQLLYFLIAFVFYFIGVAHGPDPVHIFIDIGSHSLGFLFLRCLEMRYVPKFIRNREHHLRHDFP